MRKILAKCLLAVGMTVVVMFSQGCKRKAPAPTPAAPRAVPAPRVEPFPSDAGAVDDTLPPQPARPRRTVAPAQVQRLVDDRETEAEAAAREKQRDARLQQQEEAASQRQQQELNQTVEQIQKAQEQQQEEPRIQDAPGPGPAPRIQEAPGPAPAPRIQDAPGPSQPVQPQAPPPQV
jgi:hypothetical protein